MIAAATVLSEQLRLVDVPMVGVYPYPINVANNLLVRWAHKLGPCNRPFRQEAYALEMDGRAVAIAISASIVNGPVGGFERDQVVELARLAACEPWANRVMLRLWREVCARRWACWPVRAAVSYSHNAHHRGDLYRFDGWTRVRDDCGSGGGGSWSRTRYASDAVHGKKSLWIFEYPHLNPGGPA